MTGKDMIKMSLRQSREWLRALLQDLREHPTACSFPGGNHPLWILGHVVCSESNMISGMVLGEESPLKKWDGLFRQGTQPVADPARYPAWDELMKSWDQVRATTLRVLDGLSDADLDAPSKCRPEISTLFGRIGQVFAMLTIHAMHHAGQVADTRKALGKPPVFA